MAKSYSNLDDPQQNREPYFEEEPEEWRLHKAERFKLREQQGKIPDKLPSKPSGPQKLESPSTKQSPEWEDLTDEEKALYKSPMKYGRILLERKMNGGEDNDTNSY